MTIKKYRFKLAKKHRTPDEEKYYSRNKKVWGMLAPFYDFIVLPISSLRNQVVVFAGETRPAKVLDVATGTGKQAFAFAKKGFDVTGVDLSEAMLGIAKEINMYKNVKFQVADAANLPFSNNSFDIACISFALHEMPLSIEEKVLEEMSRVTKNEGKIIIVDYGLPRNRFGRFFVYHFVRIFEGKTYKKFVRSNLKTMLEKVNARVVDEVPELFGIARILRGEVRKDIMK